MSRARFAVFVLLLGAFVLSLPTRTTRADNPAGGKKPAGKRAEPAKSPAKFSDKELKKRWAELLARREEIMQALETLQADFQAAKGIEKKQKVQERFEQLRTEFQNELSPALNELAEVVNKKDPADPVAAQILIGRLLAPSPPGAAVPEEDYARIVALAKGLTRDDKETKAIVENLLGILLGGKHFAQVAAIADKLAEAKDANPRIVVLDGLAHLYLSDFDRALALAQRAAPAAAVSEDAAQFVKDCGDYVEYWKQELEIRAKEKEADDLPRVLLRTTQGDIVLELFENEAPNTVANFISLVEAKKYDGLPFHRYEPNFVIQGGAMNAKDKDPHKRGGPGYHIACECFNGKARMHFRGSLSMAHAGRDTGGSQFFIAHTPTPHLNWAAGKPENNHTVFGRVLEGLDAALLLRAGDRIESARVLRKRDHAYVPEKISEKLARKPTTSR